MSTFLDKCKIKVNKNNLLTALLTLRTAFFFLILENIDNEIKNQHCSPNMAFLKKKTKQTIQLAQFCMNFVTSHP